MIEQRGQLRRLQAARRVGGQRGAGSGVLTEHCENGRAGKTVETFAPIGGVLGGGRVGEQGAEVWGCGEGDACVAKKCNGDFSWAGNGSRSGVGVEVGASGRRADWRAEWNRINFVAGLLFMRAGL